jgi:hypothetical protein
MIKVKGTDIKSLRKLFERRGAEAEKSLLRRLSPEIAHLYQHSLPISWNPMDDQVKLYEEAAPVLFPNDASALRRLGYAMADETFGGIYKMFLAIPSLSFIIGQAATIWKQYYEKGQASVETFKEGNKVSRVTFTVRAYPELPRSLREAICGYLQFLGEAAGEKNLAIKIDETDPQGWRWEILLNR